MVKKKDNLGMTHPKDLLLVDKNEEDLSNLSKILGKDYFLMRVGTDEQAIKFLTRSHEVYAVILCIDSANTKALDVLRFMRSNAQWKHVPVIVITEKDETTNDAEEQQALSLGANDFFTKPFKADIVKNRIANVVFFHETFDLADSIQNDPLTGVFSKDFFYVKAENYLKEHRSAKCQMVCADIEKFKLVNDLYGSAVGDELLKSCSRILKKELGVLGICGRVGPDVFAFLMEPCANEQKLFAQFTQEVNEFAIDLTIQVKFGIYPIEDFGEQPYLMCDRAELAIDSIKGKFDVLCRTYDGELRKKLIREQAITSRMQSALADEEFEVYFQPKFEIESSRIVGAEALVRWNDAYEGLRPPCDFIPLFERNGFIGELDRFVWEKCFAWLRNWMDRGNTMIPISINVSRSDLYNPNIEKIFLGLMEKYHIRANMIHLEITESAYTENSGELNKAIAKLKKLGFIIEMDDFGTGYSSLNMLADLPIDVVKLDIGFFQNKKQTNSRNILSFIISMAKWMNLVVIAEGVEKKEQVDMLHSFGCRFVQGFYFAKPMPQNLFEAKLLKQQLRDDSPVMNPKCEEQPVHSSSMLVVNETSGDIFNLANFFRGIYSVHAVKITENLHDFIKQHRHAFKIILLAVDEQINENRISEIVEVGRQFDLPVLAILENQSRSSQVIELGVNDFILRPFEKNVIQNRVSILIQNARTSAEVMEREIQTAISQIKMRAEQDSLTGLLNRGEFEAEVGRSLQSIDPEQAFFVMLDVDNFKNINDQCGHTAGDRALQSIANALHCTLPNNAVISRMGGDEFAVFVPSAQRFKLEKQVTHLCESLNWQVFDHTVTCSGGICCVSDAKPEFGEVYRKADIALLNAKHNGKHQCCFFTEGMEIPVDDQLQSKAVELLEQTREATFVCDAQTSEVIYLNRQACLLANKSKQESLGQKCYELFWDRCRNCDRCVSIDDHRNDFYEEAILLKDGSTRVDLRAKVDSWDGRLVKVHYLSVSKKPEK